jgi:hypothetical protein
VLVVIGSRFDAEAQALVARWGSLGAALLDCEDLSKAGWQLSLNDGRASTAVVGGAVLPTRSIRGVVVRRPQVFVEELGHVAPEDRAYVAAEMNAFLLCWLARLPCPVLNRPTPACLSGPNWSRQQWVHEAARAGVRVRAICSSSDLSAQESHPTTGETIAVTVIGGRCLGAPREDVAALARRIAVAAGVVLLGVRFELGEGSPIFLDANLFPSLTDPTVADTVLDALSQADVRSGAET